MPNAGGRYVMRNGKRERVHNTAPTPATPPPEDKAEAPRDAVAPALAAPKAKPAIPAAKEDARNE